MPRVLLYGSCVSRDTVAFNEDLTVSRYVARQSLISATTRPVVQPAEPSALTSRFQRDMVASDFESTGLDLLRDSVADSDVLLVDLIDERLGVLQLANDQFVTRSSELVRSGHIAHLPRHRWLQFGSDEHFDLWRVAADRFVKLLDDQRILSRSLLVWAHFAAFDENGEPAPRFRDTDPDVWNSRYVRYYQHLADAGLTTYKLPMDVRTSSAHRWGPDPYHYTDDVYMAIADQVRKLQGR